MLALPPAPPRPITAASPAVVAPTIVTKKATAAPAVTPSAFDFPDDDGPPGAPEAAKATATATIDALRPEKRQRVEPRSVRAVDQQPTRLPVADKVPAAEPVTVTDPAPAALSPNLLEAAPTPSPERRRKMRLPRTAARAAAGGAAPTADPDDDDFAPVGAADLPEHLPLPLPPPSPVQAAAAAVLPSTQSSPQRPQHPDPAEDFQPERRRAPSEFAQPERRPSEFAQPERRPSEFA